MTQKRKFTENKGKLGLILSEKLHGDVCDVSYRVNFFVQKSKCPINAKPPNRLIVFSKLLNYRSKLFTLGNSFDNNNIVLHCINFVPTVADSINLQLNTLHSKQ